MHDPNRRQLLIHAGLATAATLWSRPARACEFNAATLRVTHPWTRATAVDAPHALLCMGIDAVTRTDRLLAVQTPVAERVVCMNPELRASATDLPLELPAGTELRMHEQGIHLRLLGLRQPLELARSYPLTLDFEFGGRVNALLNVDYQRFA